jgi:hypothetical protein
VKVQRAAAGSLLFRCLCGIPHLACQQTLVITDDLPGESTGVALPSLESTGSLYQWLYIARLSVLQAERAMARARWPPYHAVESEISFVDLFPSGSR